MFKSWQVFVFSLVPLALVLTGVIVGSIHFDGGDSQAEVFPTAAPQAETGPSPTPVPGASQITVVAENNLFTTRTLSVTANQPVQVTMDNRDAGGLHNFSLYTNSSATTNIFRGELFAGPGTRTETFTAPAAGNYFFRCDAHPDTMTGTLTAR